MDGSLSVGRLLVGRLLSANEVVRLLSESTRKLCHLRKTCHIVECAHLSLEGGLVKVGVHSTDALAQLPYALQRVSAVCNCTVECSV